MIKLIVTDIDGTIVGKDEILHNEMISYVRELNKRGILYTVATGRVDGLVRGYIEKMQIKLPYVACNGGTILQGDRVLERKTIPLSALKPLIERADLMGMSVMYSLAGKESALRETEYILQQQRMFNRYYNPGGFSDCQWEQLQVDKVIIMAAVRDGSIGEIEKFCKVLPAEIGYKRYADKSIDILNAQATKEAGIQNLAKRIGVMMAEVLFVGDDLNDIQSMKAAGIGVAVANAQPPAREAADYITKEACYKGVIEAIEKFVIRGGRYYDGV